MPVTTTGIADGHHIQIRLLQFRPAWALHCFLRFKSLPYLSESTGSPESLGLRVPLLIDGNHVFAERLAIEHLSSDRRTRNSNDDFTTESYDSDLAVRQIQTAEKQMCDHIEVSVLLVYRQMESSLEKKKTFGVSLATRTVGKLQSLLKVFDISRGTIDERPYPECDTHTLLVRLDAIYAELNELLLQNNGALTSICITAPSLVTSVNIIIEGQKKMVHSKGAAEALLFGHLAEALSNPLTLVLIQKYDSLMLFVRNILEEYFLIPMRSPKVSLRLSLWEDATQSILNNAPFQQMPSNFIKESLLTSNCPISSKLPDDANFSRDRIGNNSPPRSPGRVDHSSPRKLQESLKPHTLRPYNADCIGTEMSAEDIRRLRLVGPATVLDIQTELCGRHLLVPHCFRYVFPHLCEGRGCIRLSARRGVDAVSEYEKDFSVGSQNGHGKAVADDSTRFSQSPGAKDSSEPILATRPSLQSSEEVEVSLLGAVFVAVVGATFFVNIAFGKS